MANFVAAPGLMVTLALVPVLLPDVAVKVPAPEVPVYFINVVRSATPEGKSPAPVNLLVPDKPDIAPVRGESAAIVTLLVDASKLVIVLPEASLAVSVLVPVKATPLVCGLVKLQWK